MENLLRGSKNRLLQMIARSAPGATSLRVWLHRCRGVHIGKNVWIGYDAIIETSSPHLVTLEDGASVGIRATIIAHFRELSGVRIEAGAVIGAGAMILPNVTVGQGAVVTAGSVVTHSVEAMTLVQGNPAKAVARIGLPMTLDLPIKEFSKHLKPIRSTRDFS
mgnify:CR=1 FL=1